MKKQEQVNKLVEEAMNSVDGVEKASPAAFLLTRINARLEQSRDTVWERILWFIGKPVVAVSGLCLLLLVNAAVILNQPEETPGITEQVQNVTDEYSTTIATIYDNENP
jgi:hypothetical protein